MKNSSVDLMYDRDYFYSQCDGFVQFQNSKGKVLGKRLKRVLEIGNIKPGMRVVDIGCGRGELVLHCASKKANTLGIDISAAAIGIGNSTLNFWAKKIKGIKDYAAFTKTDAQNIPVEDQSVDVVFLIDFVEHITVMDLLEVFMEVKRILKTNGRLIIHTSPNKYYIPLMGRMLALISKIQSFLARTTGKDGKSLPWNIRPLLPGGLQKHIHLNELSSWSLRRYLSKGELKVEKLWFQLNPHYIDYFFIDPRIFQFINRLRRLFPVKHLFYADIFCIARIE